MKNSKMSNQNRKLPRGIIALVFWVVVWQLAALVVGQELLIPAPILVVQTIGELAGDTAFWGAALLSLIRVIIGFIAGLAVGILLAVATETSKLLDTLISPVIRVIRATPVASFIILAMLWIGYSMLPAFMALLMVAPVIWGNVRAGIRDTDKGLLEMAAAYSFSRMKIVRLIYVPSVMPHFYSACITSLGMAWKSGIAAEILCLPKQAVGTQLYFSKIYLETPSLFAWTIVVIIFSYLLEVVFVAVIHKLQGKRRWQL